MEHINITLTKQQLWQLNELTRREIQRLEKLIVKRIEDGKTNNATFGNSLAFNKRLLATLTFQKDTEQVKS